ncbi:MAG TPA: hypothetical protein VOB72_01350 [Candidatus Dormibacteraeota bacterium]|nr:hypothetical protein [Candidatus Dormibacteraeota bacterium]
MNVYPPQGTTKPWIAPSHLISSIDEPWPMFTEKWLQERYCDAPDVLLRLCNLKQLQDDLPTTLRIEIGDHESQYIIIEIDVQVLIVFPSSAVIH